MVSVQASLGWLHTKAVSLKVLGMILYIIHPLPFWLKQPVSTAYADTRHAPHSLHIKIKAMCVSDARCTAVQVDTHINNNQ